MEKMKTCYWNLDDRLVTAEHDGETMQQAAARVVAYLARYVRRTAISNDRLIGIENDEVLFWYKDKRDGGKKKIARVPAPGVHRLVFCSTSCRAENDMCATMDISHRESGRRA